MKCILAVSGGVDSVVLLDLMQRYGKYELAVAHFDHGIRAESAADARFVAALAERYRLPFYSERQELGSQANEALARSRRYNFLHKLANQLNGVVVTAHHQEDIIETVAINLQRGSRWRGLSGMSDWQIVRPLKGWTKQRIYDYAAKYRLEWVEDETNSSQRYLRNQLRGLIQQRLDRDSNSKVYELWQRQRLLRREIELELEKFDGQMSSRYFLIQIEEKLALELLYYFVLRRTGVSLLGRQLEQALIAIKVGRAGTVWQLGGGAVMKLTKGSVIIERVD